MLKMSWRKKNLLKACNSRSTLAYLSFKCGVVVELVTTLACHAGGRGFKSPPSRHFVFFFLIAFLQANSFASKAADPLVKPGGDTTKPQSDTAAQVKIIAKNDPIYSFIEAGKDKFHFKSNNESQFLGANFEIIKKIFVSLNIKYTFQIVPENEIEVLLKNGDADMALDMQKNNNTLKFADFPNIPTRTQNFVFFGRTQEAKNLTMTYKDILEHNYTVGISIGAIYPKEFWKTFPFEDSTLNSHLQEAGSIEENIQKLKTKRIDLFLANKELGILALNKAGAIDVVFQYKNILYWKNFYCAFSKKSKLKNILDIEDQVQKSLYKMQEENQLKEINAYWINK